MRESTLASEAQQEQDRLSALDAYDILDTPTEETFDRITRLTSRMFGVSISTVTFLDGHRQWFKSRVGMNDCETERGPAFCNVALRETSPLVVTDALADERFRENPFVLGEPHIRFYAGAPLRAPGGQVIGTLCAMDRKPRAFGTADVAALTDIAAIVMDLLDLRMLASTDSLTGAISRRAFKQEGARALALALRHKHPLSCILFDLDHFKAVNDEHGHAVGDLVLSQSVAACRAGLRKSDLIGRIGGEEFAVLLPHTTRADAIEVAQKMRAAIAGLRILASGGPIAVTASFGVASLDRSTTDLDALLARADGALYSAKEQGRNRCVDCRPVDEEPAITRRRVFKAGRITFNLGQSTIDCTVRALAPDSVGLDVISSAGIPRQFKLQIEADELYRSCRILAKNEKHIEAVFE
jgi:diguanylate cyclase (GGDEF)-like protein